MTRKKKERQTKESRKNTTDNQQCHSKVKDEGKNQGCQKCRWVVKTVRHTIRQSTRAKREKRLQKIMEKKLEPLCSRVFCIIAENIVMLALYSLWLSVFE